MAMTLETKNGLDGIVVAETQLSEVDGANGRLIIRGRDVEELAANATFEDTCKLLWSCFADGTQKIETIQNLLGQARVKAYESIKDKAELLLKQEDPMDALRTCMSTLDTSTSNEITEFARMTAASAVFTACWYRHKKELALIAPDPHLSHAADFLRMLNGELVSSAEIEAMDNYWTTISDHGMNASTFTARVVASTASDNVSCIVAAIGALKGPLHGGAPGPVLNMLDEIANPENAESWLRKELAAGRRIMGMGHRVYKVRDPRAHVFELAISKLEKSGLKTTRLTLARQIESKAEAILAELHPEKPLKANVEFYTAVLLDALRIPAELFSSCFAAGRIAGWFAHIAEQRVTGRLIRPASKYIGTWPA